MTQGYNGNQNLKNVGVKLNFTVQQAMEYVKCQDDYKHFVRNYCKIVSLDRGVIPFEMFKYQEDFLDTIHDNRFVICMLGRQLGKCLSDSINIKVRNKTTGEIRELPIGDFYRMQKDSREQQ